MLYYACIKGGPQTLQIYEDTLASAVNVAKKYSLSLLYLFSLSTLSSLHIMCIVNRSLFSGFTMLDYAVFANNQPVIEYLSTFGTLLYLSLSLLSLSLFIHSHTCMCTHTTGAKDSYLGFMRRNLYREEREERDIVFRFPPVEGKPARTLYAHRFSLSLSPVLLSLSRAKPAYA